MLYDMHCPPSYKLYESRPLPPLPPGATPSPRASPTPGGRMRRPTSSSSSASSSPSSSPSQSPYASPHASPRASPHSLYASPHSLYASPAPPLYASPTPSPYASPPPSPPLPAPPSLYTLANVSFIQHGRPPRARHAPRVSRSPSSLSMPLAPLHECNVETAARAGEWLAYTHGLDALDAAARALGDRVVRRDGDARRARREAVINASRAVLRGEL
ncbi:hypothetical protein CC85DRAFT_302704 [Cutaneotrichosporon oleaginosum]|uniref:Uncharacterized protein n=1 Tax=Cutaneotrichosporon oleaginosum TaxID=879819 RepID=A0A0J0XLM1_9TREE|nr:uncharacterized protein CC85DRAFT_302704 [Cutaneotrichosporon oleaginosum]KLT41978.1 hypothetical protein CC85DRAFT_302704 [Cutaneotrichosporon oleaginosum]TXT14362.1 hypothetical protein COLE_00555 [Cutaneotrichosporon oleaginosum]